MLPFAYNHLIFQEKFDVMNFFVMDTNSLSYQKQPLRGVPRKRCSENMQQIYKITLRHGCSPVNLWHIFRTPFLKNASGRLLIVVAERLILDDCRSPGYASDSFTDNLYSEYHRNTAFFRSMM